MRVRSGTGRGVVLMLAASTLLAGCGLKPDAEKALEARESGSFVVDPGTGEPIAQPLPGESLAPGEVPAPGQSAAPGAPRPRASGAFRPGTAARPGQPGQPGQPGAPRPGQTQPGTRPGQPAPPQEDGPGNTTGIDFDRKVIRIALHGPLTGAGVPQESFRTGTPKYWNEGPGGKPRVLKNGFRVEAVAIDDKYNAPDALRACNAAAKEYFLIVGGAGTDQIQACAQSQVLRKGNVPYLSSGVTESGLGKLSNYFGTSLTYKQQGPLIVQAAKDAGHFKGKWAVVITEGPNFADARESIVGALQKSGAEFNASRDVFLTDKAPNNCSTLAGQIRSGQYATVYFLGQPAFFAQCVGLIGSPTYQPTYTGPGPSFGINSIANLACSNTGGRYKGVYLHPSTGLDQAGQRAPGIRFQDDIEYQIYASMAGLEAAFNQVQGPLSRESFIKSLRNSSIPDLISPGADFRGGARFGGKAAFALRASCGGSPQTNRYTTLKQYNK